MIILTKTRRLGGSIIATIPSSVVQTCGLKEDEWVEIEVKKHKQDFFGSIKNLSSFQKKDRANDRE